MELLTIKIIALTVLGVLSLFFGLLPLKLRKVLAKGSKKRERIVSCLLCFGGGVLLATVFTHMLPETREGFTTAVPDITYPLAELVICAGFFLIYFVEEFVHKVFFKRDTRLEKKLTKLAAAIEEETTSAPHPHLHLHLQPHSHSRSQHSHNNNNSFHPSNSTSNPRTAVAEEPEDEKQGSNGCSVYSVNSGCGGEKERVMGSKSQWSQEGVVNPVFAGDLDATAWNPSLKESILSSQQNLASPPAFNGKVAPEGERQAEKQVLQVASGHSHGQGHGHGHSHIALSQLSNKNIASNLRSLLMILALSFHSVFEGLAVGLQEREADVWYLLGAISAHKFVIAFCMGLEILVGGTSAGLMVIYMVVFALVTPLGVAFGILVTENLTTAAGGHLLMVTILQGLAGGTILYVTFFEVLERERGRAGGRLLKLFFVVLGFGAMASFEAIGGHRHGPQDDHDHSHSHGPVHLPSTTTATPVTEDFHDHDDHDHHDHGPHDH